MAVLSAIEGVAIHAAMNNALAARGGQGVRAMTIAARVGRVARLDQARRVVVFLAAGATWSITDDSEVCA